VTTIDSVGLLLDDWHDSALDRTRARSIATRIYLLLIFTTVEANPQNLFGTAIHLFRAVRAASRELEEVAVYLKISLPRNSLLQLAEVAIGEVNHGATVGANQVVVVLRRSSHQIASAVASRMHLTDKSEVGKHIERAVYSDQPDTGVLFMNLLVYGSGGKMVMAERDCIQHSSPLWRDFIAVMSQYGCYFVLCKCHRSSK